MAQSQIVRSHPIGLTDKGPSCLRCDLTPSGQKGRAAQDRPIYFSMTGGNIKIAANMGAFVKSSVAVKEAVFAAAHTSRPGTGIA
jgi:hypothetical protein